MNTKKKILAISGSTRSQSANLHILKAIAGLSIDHWEVEIYDGMAGLPYFNPDVDKQGPPSEVENFRRKIQEADGVVICTPEYVFSLPGVLKNAIEWTVSTTVFSDKPLVIITASASGEKAHESLLLIMKTLGAQIGKGSTLLIQGAKGKVNGQGEITDEPTLEKIKKLIYAFDATLKEGVTN